MHSIECPASSYLSSDTNAVQRELVKFVLVSGGGVVWSSNTTRHDLITACWQPRRNLPARHARWRETGRPEVKVTTWQRKDWLMTNKRDVYVTSDVVTFRLQRLRRLSENSSCFSSSFSFSLFFVSPLSPVSITRLVETRARHHGPCWRVMETGHPSTRAVNSGSGNRALMFCYIWLIRFLSAFERMFYRIVQCISYLPITCSEHSTCLFVHTHSIITCPSLLRMAA